MMKDYKSSAGIAIGVVKKVNTVQDALSNTRSELEYKIETHQKREDKLHRRYVWTHPRRRR